MVETILAAEKREDRGKAAARRLRRTGRIPATLYGEIKEPMALSVDAHQMEMLLRKNFSTIDLDFNGKKHQVILRDIQRHPVHDGLIHIDFMQVKKGRKINMSVNVEFVGVPNGVKVGGILDKVKHVVEISVLPKDIPEIITLNIEHLEMGDAIRVKDIPSDNFELLDDPEEVLCRIETPRVAETPAEEEELGLEEAAEEPEVITARDKEGSEGQE